MLDLAAASVGGWDVVLAIVNLVQTGMLAWIASRGSRRRRGDARRHDKARSHR